MSLNNSTKTKENTYEVEVSVDAETFAKACNKAYKKQVKNINVPGFRKGKAPKHMIEKMYSLKMQCRIVTQKLLMQLLRKQN